MTWRVPRMWEEGDVWIIGGGPSMPRQFGVPNEVIQSVVSGTSPPSVYSPYMSFLHKKHVIGVNVAYLIGDWMDMVFFGDGGFFLSHLLPLAAFPGLKVCCHQHVEKYHWVKYVARDGNHTKGISPHPDMVSWNHNSGAAAINVAAHAGAKRILLLGFDMKMGSDNVQHWHDIYHRSANVTKKKKRHLPFDRHLLGFPAIDKDARALGIEILNVCPDSAINCFRKVTLKELIDEKKVRRLT